MIRDLKIALAVALAVSALGWGLWLWYGPRPPMTQTTYAEAKPAAVTAKDDVPVERVRTLKKAAVAGKLDLPKSVVDDPRQVVLDAVTVPPSKGGATAVAVLDTATGDTRTLIREKPPPLFSFERGGEAGIRYGISSDGPAAALFVRQDVARVGKVYFSGYAEAQASGGRAEAKAMVEVTYRW